MSTLHNKNIDTIIDKVRSESILADEENRFPWRSFEALKEIKLMTSIISSENSPDVIDLYEYGATAVTLGKECLSTAILWAMHTQQLAVLVKNDYEDKNLILKNIIANQSYIASVTTEEKTNKGMLYANSPVTSDGNNIIVKRKAPIVSGGEGADYFLVTMKSETGKTELVLVHKDDGDIRVTGGWNAMGMRGTSSVPMQFDVIVGKSRIINAPFRDIAIMTLIPIGHIGYACCWFGAAKGAYERTVHELRKSGASGNKSLDSDLLFERLAKVRISVDVLEAYILSTIDCFQTLENQGAEVDAYKSIELTLQINTIKVVASKMAFEIVNDLIEISGLFIGYLKHETGGIERVFRDLRAASLMYHNDRLLIANGHLLLLENSSLDKRWN